MSRAIEQRELSDNNATVFEAVAAGETFIVTRNGTPVAELRPVQQRRPRFASRAALIETAGRGPHIDAAGFGASLDAAADQGV